MNQPSFQSTILNLDSPMALDSHLDRGPQHSDYDCCIGELTYCQVSPVFVTLSWGRRAPNPGGPGGNPQEKVTEEYLVVMN